MSGRCRRQWSAADCDVSTVINGNPSDGCWEISLLIKVVRPANLDLFCQRSKPQTVHTAVAVCGSTLHQATHVINSLLTNMFTGHILASYYPQKLHINTLFSLTSINLGHEVEVSTLTAANWKWGSCNGLIMYEEEATDEWGTSVGE